MTHDLFDESNLISSYTRREMIENGDLIDVSETAREAGIRYPTALTAAAWQQCVAVPPGVTGQDERGRLYAEFMIRRSRTGAVETNSREQVHITAG